MYHFSFNEMNYNRTTIEVSFLARNRLINTRAIFEMISTIEIQEMPKSGPGQILTITVYSSVLP